MKWLDKLTSWFSKHVVEPFIGTELPGAQLEVDVPDINPTGPIKPQPIEFDRSDRYIPLKETHDLTDAQIEEIDEYLPDGLTENQAAWARQMAYQSLSHGEEWAEIMEDMIFDFWEWFRTNYGPGAA